MPRADSRSVLRRGESITTGVTAHICDAAPGGPRFDPNMTVAQRRHYDNGIWLCLGTAPWSIMTSGTGEEPTQPLPQSLKSPDRV